MYLQVNEVKLPIFLEHLHFCLFSFLTFMDVDFYGYKQLCILSKLTNSNKSEFQQLIKPPECPLVG